MHIADYVIIILVAAWFIASILYVRKRKKQGRCIGCSGCSGCTNAENCPKASRKTRDVTKDLS